MDLVLQVVTYNQNLQSDRCYRLIRYRMHYSLRWDRTDNKYTCLTIAGNVLSYPQQIYSLLHAEH